MIAVIKTGGKQYIVRKGQILHVEKLAGDAGSVVAFPEVLCIADEASGSVTLGSPLVAGATVTGTLTDHIRGEKVTVIKYKRKVRYKRKQGHRQSLSVVRIDEITAK